MCGRTSCHLPRDVLTRACAYHDRQGRQQLPQWRDPDKYCPSYNKSPQSSSPVLLSRLHFEKDADSSERIIIPMRWGLVPSWFKESDPSKLQFNTTNCRSDTIMEKQSFKVPLGKGRRCVVLADGFYEWQRCQGTSQRQPYFIYFPQIKTEKSGGNDAADSPDSKEKVWDNWRLLTMAGIFDCWEPPEGERLYSYSIITVDSCRGLSEIHNRMPAILDGEEAVSKWLDFGEVTTQEALQLIHPIDNITFHPVSSVVNNSRNNTPECLAPAGLVVKKVGLWKSQSDIPEAAAHKLQRAQGALAEAEARARRLQRGQVEVRLRTEEARQAVRRSLHRVRELEALARRVPRMQRQVQRLEAELRRYRVVAASEASWHHRTGMEGRKMQHLAPVRLFQALGWQPHVAMDCGIVDCNMEAIRGSVALQEGVDVTSWREHPAIQKNWI